ncbi:MAG: 4-hydroxybenzoyl-CoA reductase subunit alpha [Alphaproteobacteria bacterium MarineAlpha11_Bin1]|nr:MAG: 4-hydroxybenzoyl-CoA reductase subunit alpha [Alphaproteobacteria bacterium MarineAlpha11_Bin1]|tara:strand:- start:4241 stop:6535 length:2295 start_codon:yes stop_codon:yes gene_type:complete
MNETSPALSVVGADLPRTDSVPKTTGAAVYTVDVSFPGMLHAKVLRSPHAHARVVSVDASAARGMPGIHAVLTRDELDGLSPVYGYFIKDQPIIGMDKVRYVGDPVAAVAAETEHQAIAALEKIKVEYDLLPVLANIEDAMAKGAAELFEEEPLGIIPAYGQGASGHRRIGPNNCYRFSYETGNASSAFNKCDHVFEDRFVFSRDQHFHLEPFVSVARYEGDVIEVWSSCQNPFPLRKELARVFRHPENRIRVKVPYIGAGYGAKNNCKAEPLAILLAKLSGRPVRFCMTMEENFLTQCQHAAVLEIKSGVMDDGTFVARSGHILLNAGAYSDASPLVAEKAGYRLPGPYRWQHLDIDCDCILTNTTPAGPYRGFGGTQACWASESQVDIIARALERDPMDLRIQNLKSLGEAYVPGESGLDSDLSAGMSLVAGKIGYNGRKSGEGRGMGLSIGFKDAGGVNKPAQARVRITTNGGIYLQCGTVEIGQGVHTALSQIVAELLNAPLDRVSYPALDTDYTPFDQGTNASSAIVVMAKAVEEAALQAKMKVLNFAADQLECSIDDIQLDDWSIRKGNQSYPLPFMIMRYYGGTGYEFTGEGFYKVKMDHSAPLETQCVSWEFGWGAAEVEVDTETGLVQLKQLVVSGDAGRAINPRVCRGQDEGSAVMGLTGALFPCMVYDEAVLINGNGLDYRVPRSTDLNDGFISILQEQGHGPGPYGAKSVGEGCILPVASAIANAIEDAIGVRIRELPMTPERVLAAIDASR